MALGTTALTLAMALPVPGLHFGPPASAPQAFGAILLSFLVALLLGLALGLVVLRQALAANTMLLDPRTGKVAWGVALRVYWGMLWRGFLYGLVLGFAAAIVGKLIAGAPALTALFGLLYFAALLISAMLALKNTLHAVSEQLGETPMYVNR